MIDLDNTDQTTSLLTHPDDAHRHTSGAIPISRDSHRTPVVSDGEDTPLTTRESSAARVVSLRPRPSRPLSDPAPHRHRLRTQLSDSSTGSLLTDSSSSKSPLKDGTSPRGAVRSKSQDATKALSVFFSDTDDREVRDITSSDSSVQSAEARQQLQQELAQQARQHLKHQQQIREQQHKQQELEAQKRHQQKEQDLEASSGERRSQDLLRKSQRESLSQSSQISEQRYQSQHLQKKQPDKTQTQQHEEEEFNKQLDISNHTPSKSSQKLSKKDSNAFSHPVKFDPIEQQRKFFHQLHIAQRQHLLQQQIHQQQQLILEQQKLYKDSSGYESTVHQSRSYEVPRHRPGPPSYPHRPKSVVTATQITTAHISTTHSIHVYANARAGGSGPSPVPEMGIKSMEVEDDSHVVETVEISKRPGQTLGFYIREGNGFDRSDGVFISRIQMGTVAQTNGLLHVGDEIVTVNNVKVGRMSLDDVVILMSIPKKLVLTIRTRRNGNKNRSCPSLPMAEKPDPPIVVLKKGRSSSASALEMTEKCSDLYEPGNNYSQFPLQSSEYLHRRDVSSSDRIGQSSSLDRATAPSSRYASIFISPSRAEARLLSDDGIDSSASSDGSLPRSLDSSRDRSHARKDHTEPKSQGYMSVTNPIYDHFPSFGDNELLSRTADNLATRKPGAISKSPSKQSPLGMISGYRPRTSVDTSPAFSEPPYMNIGGVRDGQAHFQQHHHHQQFQQQTQFHQNPQQYTLSTVFPPSSSASFLPPSSSSYMPATSSVFPPPSSVAASFSPQYRGGMAAISQEEKRRQERLRTLLNSKSRYGKLFRSRSPECYNSDSELILTQQTQADGRGFASDYENYGPFRYIHSQLVRI